MAQLASGVNPDSIATTPVWPVRW